MKIYATKKIALTNGEVITYRQTADVTKPVLLLIHGNMSSSVQ